MTAIRRFLATILVIVATMGCYIGASAHRGMTRPNAATFAYDVPTVVRGGVQSNGTAGDVSMLLTDAREVSASPSVRARGMSTTPSGAVVATEAVPGIKTPYGVAEQGTDAGSIALRGQVESGGTVYRQGVTGTQQTAEGQFWAGQNPASIPGYANSYGTPGTPVAPDEYPWIMGGTVEPGTPFVTRGAPGIGTNLGGAPEVVVNPGGVRNLWFHMPD